MNRWEGKIAVVTGATAGIGAAIAKDLVRAGLIVVGLGRRVEKMEKLKSELEKDAERFHPYYCDVSSLDSVKEAFKWIKENVGRLNVLVNNAGIIQNTSLLTVGNEDKLKTLIDVNLMGFVYATKAAYEIMKEGTEECHIINIGSIAGHSVPVCAWSSAFNIYPSSKFAMRAAAEVLRQELIDDDRFRVTTINPGLVKTEIVSASGSPNADAAMSIPEILQPEDVSQTVLFALQMPRHAVISELTIKPRGEKM